jgi:methylenetetrahydrofolate dehydrogenase (NAD+)
MTAGALQALSVRLGKRTSDVIGCYGRITLISSWNCIQVPAASFHTTTPLLAKGYSKNPKKNPQVIDITELSLSMRERVKQYVQTCKQSSVAVPKLVGILAESTDAAAFAKVYSDSIADIFHEDGLAYECIPFPGETPSEVEDQIQRANKDNCVDGILVFYPIFPQTVGPYMNNVSGVRYKSYDDWLCDVVDVGKDVEGLHHEHIETTANLANMTGLFRARAAARQAYIPCTASAVLEILRVYGHLPVSSPLPLPPDTSAIPDNSKVLCGLNEQSASSHPIVTIVNRSDRLGRPLAALLALQGATVYSVDDKSIIQFSITNDHSHHLRKKRIDISLEGCLQKSSWIVTGVPDPSFKLPIQSLSEEALIVDVSEHDNVDLKELALQRPHVRYVPNVGKVTVAALEQNLVRLHQSNQRAKKAAGACGK